MEGALASVPPTHAVCNNPGGKGHEFCKRRFIDPETRAKGSVFVSASLKDNAQNLDVEAYKRDSLSKLDPVTRLQREDGNWNAYPGGRFDKANFRYHYKQGDYCILVYNGVERCRFIPKNVVRFAICDPAASSKKTADHTVVGVFSVAPGCGDLVWLHAERFQAEIPDVVPRLQEVQKRWKPSYMGIEAVASNRAVLQLAQRASNPSIICSPLSPGGEDKLVRATPAINMVASGRVWLPADNPTFPLAEVESELIRYTGDQKQDAHDDCVDVLAYACRAVTGGVGGRAGSPFVIQSTGARGGALGLPWRGQSR